MEKKKVRFQFQPHTASGRRKGWGKWLTRYNPAAEGLRQFEGDFLADGVVVEAEEGRLFVDCNFSGSAKYSGKVYEVCEITGAGDDPVRNFKVLKKFDTKTEFLDFVEFVKSKIQGHDNTETITMEDKKKLRELLGSDPLLLQKVFSKIEG